MTKRYLENDANQQLLDECRAYGFTIRTPNQHKKEKFITIGAIFNINDENCELLELIEISDYKELWQVRIIDTGNVEFRFI